MASYLTPGIYVEELKPTVQPIEGVSTSIAAFIGVASRGPVNEATLVTSVAEFVRLFGGPIAIVPGSQEFYLYYAVRHFFIEGGTKCYVARVTGYADVNLAASIQALSASHDFDAVELDGSTAAAGALHVEALTPGTWGEELEVQVESASKFSVLVAESVTGAVGVTQLTLAANSDVQVGSVLLLVEQVPGVVQSVDPSARTVTVLPGLTAESAAFTFAIPNAAKVFSPDFKFQAATSLAAPVSVTTAVVSSTITLTSVTNLHGELLKAGDIINFGRGNSGFVVVKKITEKVLATGETAMVVQFDPTTLPNLDHTHTRAYARDFDLVVMDGGTVAETHTHLSLVATNRRDYVDDRLAPASGASNLITASRVAVTNGVTMVDTAFTALANGDDGLSATPAFGDDDIIGSPATGTGLYALDNLKDISLLVIPNASDAVAKAAIAYCERRSDLFFIIDLPSSLSDPVAYVADKASSYAAIYYPWIIDDDPLTGKPVTLPPSGAIAGTYAATDVARGVHKAPAGVDNGYLNSATGIQRSVTQAENDVLYQAKVNVIRAFPEGILVWGARTLSADPAWRYVNVRRLFIFLEQSIERGLQWVVFEPNEFSLWKSIERNVSTFLRAQWEGGALVGATDAQAFFVHCNQTTNTPATVAVGQVITEIGVAPSKPAEFVVFRFKQLVATN